MFILAAKAEDVSFVREDGAMQVAQNVRNIAVAACFQLFFKAFFFVLVFSLFFHSGEGGIAGGWQRTWNALRDPVYSYHHHSFHLIMGAMLLLLLCLSGAAFLREIYLALDRRQIRVSPDRLELLSFFPHDRRRDIPASDVAEIFIREDILQAASYYSAGVSAPDGGLQFLVSIKAKKNSFGYKKNEVPEKLRDFAQFLGHALQKPVVEKDTHWLKAAIQYVASYYAGFWKFWR